MLAGIIGDVIGSVYEAQQWQRKDLSLIQSLPFDENLVVPLLKNAKWVRQDYSWTDDTLCTLALYSAYIHKSDPVETMVYLCKKYFNESIGFGKSFNQWLDNPIPYESFGNGAIMRIGFIPFLNLNIQDKIQLGIDYTNISHNHKDSLAAVVDFILLCEWLKDDKKVKNFSKRSIQTMLNKYQYLHSVEDLHKAKSFEINALTTFLQACVIVLESQNMHEVLVNSFYVGGDSDTLACIACNLASMIYPLDPTLWSYAEKTLTPFSELHHLVSHFQKLYANS